MSPLEQIVAGTHLSAVDRLVLDWSSIAIVPAADTRLAGLPAFTTVRAATREFAVSWTEPNWQSLR